VTLVQPSAELRARGLDPTKLDPASRARIKEELFGRHLETLTIEAKAQDQLTCELKEFIDCIQTGASPRAGAAAGREAVVLAERILTCIAKHSWTGVAQGPVGPHQVPASTGTLFPPRLDQEVA
jgi:hypothetical protein